MIECRLKPIHRVAWGFLGIVLAVALPVLAWVIIADLRTRTAFIAFIALIVVLLFRSLLIHSVQITFSDYGILRLRCRPLTFLGILIPEREVQISVQDIERVTVLRPRRSPLDILRSRYVFMFESRSFLWDGVLVLWQRGSTRPIYQREFGRLTHQDELLQHLKNSGIPIAYE